MLITVTPAESHETPLVLGILDEAAEWLRTQGIEQWPARFSSSDDWRENRITRYVAAGETFLLRAGAIAIGTFTLSAADPHYAAGWPDGPETGLYVYRMAVRRAAAGLALGDAILDWASARSAAFGYRWLRLDCHRRNPALQHYYEQRGFTRVGTLVHVIEGVGPDGGPYERGSGALYQRPAGTIMIPSHVDRIGDAPSGVEAAGGYDAPIAVQTSRFNLSGRPID